MDSRLFSEANIFYFLFYRCVIDVFNFLILPHPALVAIRALTYHGLVAEV